MSPWCNFHRESVLTDVQFAPLALQLRFASLEDQLAPWSTGLIDKRVVSCDEYTTSVVAKQGYLFRVLYPFFHRHRSLREAVLQISLENWQPDLSFWSARTTGSDGKGWSSKAYRPPLQCTCLAYYTRERGMPKYIIRRVPNPLKLQARNDVEA